MARRQRRPAGAGVLVLAIALTVTVGGARAPLPRALPVAPLAAVLVGLTLAAAVLVAAKRALPARATQALVEIGVTERHRPPKLRRVKRTTTGWEIAWRMPAGASVSTILRKREEIEQALDVSTEFWFDRGLVHMRAAGGRIPRRVDYADFYREHPPAGELPIGIGIARSGRLWADLTELPHLLVGGQTSGGKSAFIRQLLTWLVITRGPEELRIALIDLKGGLELNAFSGLPHAIGPLAGDLTSCLELLELLLAELDRRQIALQRFGAEDVRRWNAAQPDRQLPYVLVVIDEMAELSAVESADRDEKARRQAALASVSRLARVGRALGFHVIASTQRPDAEAVPGQIKANMPATVAFRVRSAVNSRILLGEDNAAAAALPPIAGRGIWQHDREVQFQGIWLDKKAAEAILAPLAASEMAGTERVTPCLRCPPAETREDCR